MECYRSRLLKKKNSQERMSYWIGYVVEIEGRHYTQQEYWQEKADGEDSVHTFSELSEKKGKNIGKANETSDREQAIAELESLVNSKRDEGYGEEAKEIFLPMLAQKFNRKKAEFPAYIQPKLDGVRAYFREGKFYSRKGKLILPEVVEHIKLPNANVIIDGELMLPPPYNFQETVSAVKKVGELTKQLKYYVFDSYDGNELGFGERYNNLFAYLLNNSGCEIVCANLVYTLEEFEEKAAQFITQGYEGAMYRIIESPYKVNIRSSNLLKYKEFEEGEFEIIGYEEGEGREKGAAIYVCKTIEGKEFTVRPVGSIEDRKIMFLSRENIGKMYTVKHQGWTESKIPRFPVGKGIRDYE